MSRSTARFKPLLSIPKYASGGIGRLSLEKQPAKSIASGEEHEYHQGHDQRDCADHREYRGTLLVHLPKLAGRSRVRPSVSERCPANRARRSLDRSASSAPTR